LSISRAFRFESTTSEGAASDLAEVVVARNEGCDLGRVTSPRNFHLAPGAFVVKLAAKGT